jgi:hypothetical protein
MLDEDNPILVQDRVCGSCNVCCVDLTINEPGLRKVQGYRCPNAQPDNSCRIYADRPHTCRTFFCGWRRLKWIKASLRPDTSGVLVGLHYEKSPDQSQPGQTVTRMAVSFTLLHAGALKAEGLAESVSAAVAADVPVYLVVPGPPGHTSARARINDALRMPVIARDKAAVLDVLRLGRNQARKGKFEPIVLANVASTKGSSQG